MRITDLRKQQEMPADTILKEIGVSKAEREYIVEFLPLIPLALWGAGAAWTAYDTYKSKKQMDNGEITQAEFTKRVGRDVAITLLAGPTLKLVGGIGKLGWKGGKKVMSMVGAGGKVADEVVDVSTTLAKKIDDVPPLYTSGSTAVGSAATRAAVNNIDNVAIAARQAADKGATVAKNSSQAVTDIATSNAAKQATKVAVSKIDNVAIAAKQAADRGATVAKNSSQAVTDIATAKAAKTAAAIATKKAAQLAAKKAAQTAASDSKLIGIGSKVATKKAADLATKKAAQLAARKAAQTAASDSKLIGIASKVAAKKIAAKKLAQTTASDSRLLGLAGKVTAKKIAAKKAAQTAASDSRLIGLAARTGAKKIDNVIAKKVGNTVVKKVDNVVAKTVVKKGGKRGSKWLRRMKGALRGGGDSGAGYDSNLQNVVKKYGY